MHRIVDKSQDLYPFLIKLGNLDRDEYEKKINHIAKRYSIISMQECLEYIKKGNSRPRNCVILTFDDGHHDLYWNAYPILKEKQLPAIIFLTAGLIDSEEMTWFDKVDYIMLKTKVMEFQIQDLSDKTYSILSDEDRIDALLDMKEKLKSYNSHERKAIIEKILETLKVDLSKYKGENRMLSWKDVMEMSGSGFITFGSHGMLHPILTNEFEENIEYEIAKSKEIIEHKLGKPVFAFAYPNGNFNEITKDSLKKNGYLCAVTTIRGINNENVDCLELKRIGFFDGPIYVFGVKLALLPWMF